MNVTQQPIHTSQQTTSRPEVPPRRIRRIRYLDSAFGPFLFGLGPSVLSSFIWTQSPGWREWANTWPGASISAGIHLVIIAIAYYAYGDDPVVLTAENKRWASHLPSYLLPMQVATITTRDARDERKEVFRPYLGTDIDALETGGLDLPDRVFNYGGWRWTSIMSVPSSEHLSPGREGLGEKLETTLNARGRMEMMGKVWLFTMPTILGWRGCCPFSIWCVYTPEGGLQMVVLEIHHTFGEPQTVHFLAKSESQSTSEACPTASSTSEAYTHSFVIPIETPLPASTLKLDIVDPFPTPPRPNIIPRPIISLSLCTPTTQTQTILSPYPSTSPAPLRISQCGKVWFVLFEWPKSLVPARVYEQGLVSTLYGWVGEAEDWVTDMLGLTGRWTWRGQGGWHA